MKDNHETTDEFTITEDRVEQWDTRYAVKELGISGKRDGMISLVEELAKEVKRLRSLNKE